MSNETKKPLKKLLQDHFNNQLLDEHQLDELLDLQVSAAQVTPQAALAKDKSWTKQLVLHASLSACVLALVISLWAHVRPDFNRDSLVEEIALNHLQPFVLEVGSSSLADVDHALSHLPFSLVNSTRIDSQRWTLLGGRYCSIQGQLAAQLKMLDKKSQKIVTLYQSAVPFETTSSFSDKTLRSDSGVNVSIWWENGVMLALAQ